VSEGETLRAAIDALIETPHARIDAAEVERLAVRLFRWQYARNTPLARIADAALDGRSVTSIDDIPAVPTDAFKVARVACFERDREVRVFRTSGTTRDTRGLHAFEDLALYERAAVSAAKRWLLPAASYRFALLAEDERDAPDSSLSFMLARFAERWNPADEAFCIRRGVLDVARVRRLIEGASHDGVPVALLGAAYGFVHLLDAMGDARVSLPPDSVVMPTGGFKGRSREVEPEAFYAMIQARFGVTRAQIVGEYGMTELSSQAYEAHREGCAPGVFRAPPWMHVTAVDPESLARVAEDEVGILRVVDLANVGSAVAIQTSDLGRITAQGFEVLGRAPGATPRGCSRALDAALSDESR
jgi:Acyl-protein synthetase, LuxE